MSTESLVTFTYYLQPKNTTDEIPLIGSASGSGSGENTGLVSHENTELVYEIKATINTTTCLTLHHGWDIIGEIYPWYQFRSIDVGWSGVSITWGSKNKWESLYRRWNIYGSNSLLWSSCPASSTSYTLKVN